MSITRKQVADLQPGDVVELHRQGWADDVVVRGTVRGDSCIGELYLGDYSLVSATGQAPVWLEFPGSSLTVVSRAPRPLYVNHPRTEPVRGDVARDDESGNEHRVWVYGRDHGGSTWFWAEYPTEIAGPLKTVRLRLLVDGETGMTVSQ